MSDGRQGRPASVQPATAYDFRRPIALVQVLAIDDDLKRDRAICELARSYTNMLETDIQTLPIENVISCIAAEVPAHREEQS